MKLFKALTKTQPILGEVFKYLAVKFPEYWEKHSQNVAFDIFSTGLLHIPAVCSLGRQLLVMHVNNTI